MGRQGKIWLKSDRNCSERVSTGGEPEYSNTALHAVKHSEYHSVT